MSQRKLVRSTEHRMIAGVCAGIADYFEIDRTIVRLVTLAAGLFSAGIVAGAYAVAWLILPDASSGDSGADTLYDRYGDYRQRRDAREQAKRQAPQDETPTDTFRADD